MARLISLQDWRNDTFGESGPSLYTVRRWARDGKIYPAPKKIGREYFVTPDAEYVVGGGSGSLLDRMIRGTS